MIARLLSNNNKNNYGVKREKQYFDFNQINQIPKKDLYEKTSIRMAGRRVRVFDKNSILFQNEELPEDLILVENRVIQDHTPLAYDRLYSSILNSFMISIYIFSKPRPIFNNFRKPSEIDNQITYLHGFSSGYGIFYDKNDILRTFEYGFSMYDRVNSMSDDSNLICKWHETNLFNDEVEFLGPIFPNIYTEDHYEILTKRRYNPYVNILEGQYYIKDLLEEDGQIELINFDPIYINQFEPEQDYFSLQEFEMICYITLFYKIHSIDMIYHTKRGYNVTKICFELSNIDEKNDRDFKSLLKDLLKSFDKFKRFYSTINETKSDYCFMFSVTDISFGLKVIEEQSGKEFIIKINKPEMYSRIFTKFTFNNEVIKRMNALILYEKYENMRRLGYPRQEIEDLALYEMYKENDLNYQSLAKRI